MRGFIYLWFITITFLLGGCNEKSSKPSSGYSFFQWGEYLHYYWKLDSAFLMYNRAANTTTDSVEKSRAYHYMGALQRQMGDLYGAQESLTAALRPLEENNKLHRDIIVTVYNTLGNISLDLKRYDEAITFYNAGLARASKSDTLLEIMNGKATAFQKKGSYDDAIRIYDSILLLRPQHDMLRARVISNLARTKWLRDPAYVPLDEYRLALKLRTDSHDDRGLNASYAHFSEYYTGTRKDSALFYAQKMYEKAKEVQSADDILEAMDKLIRLNNNIASKEKWYDEYKRLNDSLQLSRDTTRSRFALIRYDVQKSKADNLVLKQRVTIQRVLIYSSAALAIIVIAALTIWYNKRRKRIKQESEKAIQEARLKTSQKVHDVVANGLYTIMNELEHSEMLEKEPLITRIESLYEKSRNISYDEPLPDSTVNYDNQIHELLNRFSNDQTKVYVIGNQQTFWDKITGTQKNELQLILGEIMVNMNKHSGASSVVLRFKQEENLAHIYYTDNGKGFPGGFKFGNGLKNTVSRIKSLNGEVNFGQSGQGGASITISFPLKSDSR